MTLNHAEPAGRATGAAAPAAAGRGFGFAVSLASEHTYDVQFASGLLSCYGELLVQRLGWRRVAILTDNRVARLFGGALLQSFKRVDVEPDVLVVPEGERSKNLRTFGRLLDQLAAIGFDRRGVLVNFGGGVISDLGGYVASSYMRGVAYANFATSLMGQLDAAVGGKVAVNSATAKNLYGAFYHPRHVAGDPDLLRTLSFRDFKSGIAEAIKVGIIGCPDLFATLERDHEPILARDAQVLVAVIGLAAKTKMDWVARDPWEDDLRRPLNLGHTIGHPIETEFGYRRIRHGEAVAIGIGVATAIARRRNLVSAAAADRIFGLLQRYELLGFDEPIRPDRVIQHVRSVRLVRGNQLHFVLPVDVGAVHITDAVSEADLVHGFEDYEVVVEERSR